VAKVFALRAVVPAYAAPWIGHEPRDDKTDHFGGAPHTAETMTAVVHAAPLGSIIPGCTLKHADRLAHVRRREPAMRGNAPLEIP
jgi:hypothetical protein